MNKLIYNYHPSSGEFLSAATADASPLEAGIYLVPAFATETAPPAAGGRQVAVFSAGAWQIKADWRGVPLASTKDGSAVSIREVGVTPAQIGAVETPPPSPLYSWQGTAWVIDPAKVAEQLESARTQTAARINQGYAAAINVIAKDYPETERDSWPKQEAEARAWVANNTTATPLLSAIAAARGTTLADICARVTANADAYAVYAGGVIGKRQARMLRLAATTTIAEAEAIVW